MKIAIIGGGAAGMLAACTAADYGAAVTLYERNRLCGVKINLTGKGRCNVTNNCDISTLVSQTPTNGKFLYSAFSAFNAQDAMNFFEQSGVPLKTERGNRVFPVSDNAKDISGALKTAMVRRGVCIVNERVRALTVQDERITGIIDAKGQFMPYDRVILATGGLSYPKTGSSGDGHSMAQALGHTTTAVRPSLVPLVGETAACRPLEGLSLRNVGVCVTRGDKVLYSDFGEMLFTANGVSGPVILSASAHLKPGDFPCKLTIDLKPALDAETLDRRILRDFEEQLNRDFLNALGRLLPSRLIPSVVAQCGIPPQQKVNGITRAQREALGRTLKAFELAVTGYGSFDEAVITSGGVATREIDPKTMASRKVMGLYFAGEIMDVDAYTGGFNLQIAWSTGYLAGMSAALSGQA